MLKSKRRNYEKAYYNSAGGRGSLRHRNDRAGAGKMQRLL
jgi:hypothetical protein